MSMLDQLMEMGYPRDSAERSLKETNERSLEDALDWLETHSKNEQNEEDMIGESEVAIPNVTDELQQSTPMKAAEETTHSVAGDTSNAFLNNEKAAEGSNAETSEPKEISFKCNQCGKLLKGELEVMFHAGKTQHDVFSESTEQIKPLSKEEKEQRVADMKDKIKIAMAKKEEKERQEAIEKEKKRRIDGQATAEMLERRRQTEMRQLAEQRKREKQEEAEAKRRVLEQIRHDREARRASNDPKPVVNPPVSYPPFSGTNAENCNLQIRLPNGSSIKGRFKSTETLAAVRLWVELNRKDPESYHFPFNLMVPFPHQLFTDDDMEKPLKALGLVPSASLVVTRARN